jgi:methyl-accepting chemotaxis protein
MFTLGARLGAGFALVLLVMLAQAGVASWQLGSAGDAIATMMARPLAKERLVGDWYRAIHTSVRRTTAVVRSADPSLAAFFAPENAESSKRANELQSAVSELLSN